MRAPHASGSRARPLPRGWGPLRVWAPGVGPLRRRGAPMKGNGCYTHIDRVLNVDRVGASWTRIPSKVDPVHCVVIGQILNREPIDKLRKVIRPVEILVGSVR